MRTVLFLLLLFCASQLSFSQNSIGIGTTAPHASAQLDVTSTTKGMLIPRMTEAQRNLIATPALGLMTSDGLSAAIYTQVTDVETEVNGLFTYDRAVTKPDAAQLKAFTPVTR